MQSGMRQDDKDARFGFGRNWLKFSRHITEEHIALAVQSLQGMLGRENLQGCRLLDIGSGSGLFSLAALRMGAHVVSFDYDAHSVACTAALQQAFCPDKKNWNIMQGSVLDVEFMRSLGTFDVVYSWGVLHHTGNMWKALDNTARAVKEGGWMYIALYNDQGILSSFWKAVKRLYCSSTAGRIAVVTACIPALIIAGLLLDTCRARNPLARYRDYKNKNRGMSVYHDWIDWLGGYPFEVAAPEQVIDFYRERGFSLQKLTTTGGWGNNEFIFVMNG